MKTSWHGNSFHITGPTGTGGFPSRRGNEELWCFLSCQLAQTVEQQGICPSFETPWRSCDVTLMETVIKIILRCILLVLAMNSDWTHLPLLKYMMTSSNGNIFRVTGPLFGEFTGHRWISLTKASDAELLCFLWSALWINGWINNREVGDLRRHHAHSDVTVMTINTVRWLHVALLRAIVWGIGGISSFYPTSVLTHWSPWTGAVFFAMQLFPIGFYDW